MPTHIWLAAFPHPWFSVYQCVGRCYSNLCNLWFSVRCLFAIKRSRYYPGLVLWGTAFFNVFLSCNVFTAQSPATFLFFKCFFKATGLVVSVHWAICLTIFHIVYPLLLHLLILNRSVHQNALVIYYCVNEKGM